MLQSNITFPATLTSTKNGIAYDRMQCDTFGELVNQYKKRKGLKPKVINPRVLQWGRNECFVLKNYSIVIDTVTNEIIVYYDLDGVGMIFQYIWHELFNQFTRKRVDVSGYNRPLPQHITDFIDELKIKLVTD